MSKTKMNDTNHAMVNRVRTKDINFAVNSKAKMGITIGLPIVQSILLSKASGRRTVECDFTSGLSKNKVCGELLCGV